MDHIRIFDTLAEPSAERLRLFGIAYETQSGPAPGGIGPPGGARRAVVSHLVAKNVFTSFDARLSRHLAAVTGAGLPHALVETRMRDLATGRTAAQGAPRHAASAPAALAIAARLALGGQDRVAVRLGNWNAGDEGLGQERVITAQGVEALERALAICARLGVADFLDVSGDLDRVLVRPAGGGLDVLVMDLGRGTVAVPAVEPGGAGAQASLWDFECAADTVPAVAAYLARARHAIAAAREAAVREFREAAEERIMQFDAALAGRPLTGHRLDVAASLVARLQSVLGDTLGGLSEAARLTALDWAALMPSAATPDAAAA
jgi:hypothetical protein